MGKETLVFMPFAQQHVTTPISLESSKTVFFDSSDGGRTFTPNERWLDE
jgi:hypothetical protein